jgi:hypothetical protein
LAIYTLNVIGFPSAWREKMTQCCMLVNVAAALANCNGFVDEIYFPVAKVLWR